MSIGHIGVILICIFSVIGIKDMLITVIQAVKKI